MSSLYNYMLCGGSTSCSSFHSYADLDGISEVMEGSRKEVPGYLMTLTLSDTLDTTLVMPGH